MILWILRILSEENGSPISKRFVNDCIRGGLLIPWKSTLDYCNNHYIHYIHYIIMILAWVVARDGRVYNSLSAERAYYCQLRAHTSTDYSNKLYRLNVYLSWWTPVTPASSADCITIASGLDHHYTALCLLLQEWIMALTEATNRTINAKKKRLEILDVSVDADIEEDANFEALHSALLLSPEDINFLLE